MTAPPGVGVRCLLDEDFVPLHAGGKLCAAHVLPLAMVCYGKARRSRASAEGALRRRGTEENAAYQCPVCSDWHVGAKHPAREDGCKRAEEIVRELRAAGFAWYVGQLAGDWHPQHVHRDPQKLWRVRIGT